MDPVRIDPVKIEKTGVGTAKIWTASGAIFELNASGVMAEGLVKIFGELEMNSQVEEKKRPPTVGVTITLIITSPDGSTVELQAHSRQQIGEVKCMLAEKVGISTDFAQLYAMDDKREIEQLLLRDDHTIEEVLSFTGTKCSVGELQPLRLLMVKDTEPLRSLDDDSIHCGKQLVELDFSQPESSEGGVADFFFGCSAKKKCQLLRGYLGTSGSQLKKFKTERGNIHFHMAAELLVDLRKAGPSSSLTHLVLNHNAVISLDNDAGSTCSSYAPVAVTHLLSNSFPALLVLDVGDNYDVSGKIPTTPLSYTMITSQLYYDNLSTSQVQQLPSSI
jgi:hypothetical protein